MEPETPKPRLRRRLPKAGAWLAKCKEWGSLIAVILGSLVYAIPHLYGIFAEQAQDQKVQELIRQARDAQLRVLEKQIEELEKRIKP